MAADLVDSVTRRVMGRLAEPEPLEMHELFCYLRLAGTRGLPEELRGPILTRVGGLIETAVERDPAAWEGYSPRPLAVIDSPQSPFIAGRRELVDLNLGYEISTQNEDGSWSPTWDWGGAYPEEWERARREWSGIIPLEKLLVLARFDRIEWKR